MNRIKSLALLGMALMGGHTSLAQTLYIESNDGSTSAVYLTDVESIVFQNNNLVVNSEDCEARYFNMTFSDFLTFEENVTGIGEMESGALMSIYPNPVKNSLTIDFPSAVVSEAMVINATGEVLSSFKLNRQRNVIDITHLSSGLYFILIDGRIQKFVKQ